MHIQAATIVINKALQDATINIIVIVDSVNESVGSSVNPVVSLVVAIVGVSAVVTIGIAAD